MSLYSSNFHEIDGLDPHFILSKILPPEARLVITDNSNIVLVLETTRQVTGINLLDYIAGVISRIGKGLFSNAKRRTRQDKKLSRSEVEVLANLLFSQSKKLESMSVTYRLMASALMASKDNFDEIIRNDEYIRNLLDNPFN